MAAGVTNYDTSLLISHENPESERVWILIC